MSECVVRMEMPRGCVECPFFNKVGCKASGVMFPNWMNVAVRPKDCPIICALPEGHGRLVDMRDIESRIEIHKAACEAWTAEARTENGKNIGAGAIKAFQISLLAINEIPTVVPAERSET